MKIILVFAMLIFITTGLKPGAQKTGKKDLVFKGVENTSGGWQLKFADKKNNNWYFNAERSNTEPYIFCNRAGDGSLKANEKIIKNWFLISYIEIQTGRGEEKIIIKAEEIKK